jgi:hypothetical protein
MTLAMTTNKTYHHRYSTLPKKEQAKEYSLDKEQTSYDDLLDALRLSLKGYNII